MAQLELSQSSIAALEGIIQPLRDDIRGLGETLNAEGKQTTKGSGKSKKDKQKADKGFLKSLASTATEFGNQLSLALPGGARLFGLGKFLSAINRQKTPMGKFAVGLGQMTVAVFAVTEGLRALGRSLGGMTGAEAGKFALSALLKTVGTSPEGMRIRSPSSMLKAQTSFAGEFGGKLSADALARQADLGADTGLGMQELTQLQRTFQTTTSDIRGAINIFKKSGMLAGSSVKEMNKATDAIALAGDSFNEYIVEGIVNAKKLGYEFMGVHKQLTGFTMDFEGTVQSFSQLRAVIPGFAVDFGRLMTASLSGNQDEFVEIIRGGLAGAGVGSASELNLQQAALLEQATGFSASQIDRLLSGQEVELEKGDELSTERNSLLNTQIGIMSAILGAVTVSTAMSALKNRGIIGGGGGSGTAVGWNQKAGRFVDKTGGFAKTPKGIFGGFQRTMAKGLGKRAVGKGMMAGAMRMLPLAARGLGFLGPAGLAASAALTLGPMAWNKWGPGADKSADDFMIKDGEFIDINNRDMVGMLPQGQSLSSAGLNSQQAAYGGTAAAAQMDRLEMKKQTQAIDNLARVMSGPQEISLKNWREAERSAMDASIREA